MSDPFSHHDFRKYEFERVPLDRDIFIVDEMWMNDYEAAMEEMFGGGEYRNVGYISYAAVRKQSPNALEISWYPNLFDRFHEVSVMLPREAFLVCVDCPSYDEKPRIFVRHDWLEKLHLRPYSAFALLDAIGFKDAIARGSLSSASLVRIRRKIDHLAAKSRGAVILSFADSILIKTNWFVGKFDSNQQYSYFPEDLLKLIPQVNAIYRGELGMDIYATVTQGANEYEDQSLVHTSRSGRHICLNSLGLPFAQLLAIDAAARDAIRAGRHPPCQLYLEEHFYHSLRFKYGFDKWAVAHAGYIEPMTSSVNQYFATNWSEVDTQLDWSRLHAMKRKRRSKPGS